MEVINSQCRNSDVGKSDILSGFLHLSTVHFIFQTIKAYKLIFRPRSEVGTSIRRSEIARGMDGTKQMF